MALPEGFRPKLSRRQVAELQRLQDRQPNRINPQTKQALEEHAEYYRLPGEQTRKFNTSVKSIMGQTGAGFMEGFTTLKADNPPQNDAEAIARNVGHLAGFVGFIPSTPFKMLGLRRTAQTVKAFKGTSVPMGVATAAQRGATAAIRTLRSKALKNRVDAKDSAIGFLQNEVVRDMGSGAFHLGVASAVSSWQGGVDQMMESLIYGAGAGAVFRGIGNAVKTGNEAADKTLRTISGSLFQGLPSSVRGDTTPMQVYNYLLGGYFGLNESPVSKRLGDRHIAQMRSRNLRDPELVPGWDTYSETTKQYVRDNFKLDVANPALGAEIVEKTTDIDLAKKQKEGEKFAKTREELKFLEEQGEVKRGFVGEKTVETNNFVEDIDPQIVPSSLSQKSKSFVDRFITTESEIESIRSASKIEGEWNKLVSEGRKTGENPGYKMEEFVNKEYSGKVNTEGMQDFWINLGQRKLQEEPVRQVGFVEGEPVKFLDWSTDLSTVNMAGNKKYLTHPPKPMEEVWNKDSKSTKTQSSFAVVDHIVRKNGFGTYTEIPLDQYVSKLSNIIRANPKTYAGKKAEDVAKAEFSRLFKSMSDKGYYYFGGKGDSSNLFFQKFHPKVPSKNLDKIVKNAKDIIAKSKKEKTAFKNDRNIFIAENIANFGTRKKAGEYYDKAFISNIIYDIRMNGFETSINNKYKIENINKVLSKGFINDATSFNKRAQILLTNGYSADAQIVKNEINKVKTAHKIEDTEGDGFKYRLIKDIGTEARHKIGTPNSKYFEVNDGLIYAPDYVIKALNQQAGLPTEGGVNKSFIYSNKGDNGALMGKYMIHPASKALTKYMEANDLHMVIPMSAAKQKGFRNEGKLEFKNGKYSIKGGASYNLPIPDVKVVLSEITGKKDLQNKRMPKQLWTNYTPFSFYDAARSGIKTEKAYREKMSRIFDDMYEDLVRTELNGDKELTQRAERFYNDPKAYEKDIPILIENLDKLGMDTLLTAMKTPGAEKFANRAYQRIMKMNEDITESIKAEGELSKTQVDMLKRDNVDYGSINERIIRLMPDSLAGFLHKFPRDYRMTVMRNYFLHRLTRPTIGNSLSARMRPYEPEFVTNKEMGRLEKEDNIFFLGDNYRDMQIDASGIGGPSRTTLGKFWKDGKKLNKAEEEFFNAIVVRVPMDSMSGAHKLKFGGFTGIKDNGVLLHGRTMEALGGADLDGDKAFVFFGGKSKDGKGQGFKEDWKNLYDWSKNEYLQKDGTIKEGKSEEYNKELTIQDQNIIDNRKKTPILQYSPQTRREVSEAAALGRGRLGSAVTMASYLKTAHAAIANSDLGYFEYKVFTREKGKKPVERTVRMTPKTDKDSLQKFRERARASIGLSSDPMNEAGLNFKPLIQLQSKELFNFNYVNKQKNVTSEKVKDEHTNLYNTDSPLNVAMEINNAMYGKNFQNGQRHEMWEIMQKLEKVDGPNGMTESANTFLPMLAKDIKKMNWGDKVFKRINQTEANNVYKDYDVFRKELDGLQSILGRTSMKVKKNPIIDLVYEYGLYEPASLKKHSEYRPDSKLSDAIKKLTRADGKPMYTRFDKSQQDRVRILNDIVLKAEDFFIKDMSDIASFRVIRDLSKNMSESQIKKIANMVDKIKKESYVYANRHNKNFSNQTNLSKKELAEFQQVADEVFSEPQSRARDQFEIDNLIRVDKSNLDLQSRRLYDAMMLGTIWKGKADIVEAKIKDSKNKSENFIKEMDKLKFESAKTSLSRVGYASEAIPDVSVKRMLSEYQKMFDTAVEKSDPKFLETYKNKAENIDKVVEGGKPIEDPYKDEATGKYIDEIQPYLGLKKGKMTKEEADVGRDIIAAIDHYPNQIGTKLNGFFRDVTGADLNTASLESFKVFRNYLNETRNGTWWSNILGKPNNEISKWYYYMFPRTIDMDVARKELKLVQSRNVVETKGGRKLLKTFTPEGTMVGIQKPVHEMTSQATETFERENALWQEKISPYVDQIPEGRQLWRYAQRERELGMVKSIRDNESNSEKTYNVKSRHYIDKYNEIRKEINWDTTKEKTYDVQVGGKNLKLTGREVVDNIKKLTTDQYIRMGNYIQGKKFYRDIETEYDKLYSDLQNKVPEVYERVVIDRFLKQYDKTALAGKPLDISLGLDGFQRLMHDQQVSLFMNNANIRAELRKRAPGQTRLRDPNSFFAHYGGDRKAATKDLMELIEAIHNNKALSKKEKTEEITKQIWNYKQLTRDFNHSLDPMLNNEIVRDVLNDIVVKKKSSKEALNKIQKYTRIGNQLGREAHIPGWSVEPEVMPQYMKNVFDSMYKHAAQIKVNDQINTFAKDFYKKTGDRDLTQRWVDFYTMYAQDAMGYPQQIPTRILNDPKMGIKGTPFAYVNDTGTLNFVNKVRKKLGINEKLKGLPEEMKDFDHATLTRWGNLEAKYQLATLLAHPKSAVANLYGGSVHTLVSTGFGHFKNARDINYLKTNVNSEWKDMTDVTNWVKNLGVVEDFILYEAGFNPKFKERNFKQFLDEAVNVIKKNPDAPTATLKEVGRKYGITDRVFNKAAWFMRRPERTLRRDAFMAHYLQAREKFAGAISKYDDPILIKMGKEGVKSTQFLYSAPFRPAFARSAMGKALTRFQLWAWNSVRFRGDVLREARIRGFKEGTPEFDRFKRLATMDLLMFGLANTFMYSIFENTLPQPWSWAQDLADWSFGNEKERSRAFFGTYPTALAPLQAITPPLGRPLPGLFKAIVNDDYTSLGGYYAWSMIPFGRVGYDIFGNVLQGGKGGLIENPYRMVEKVSGLPYQQIPRQLTKYRDTDMLRPGFLFERGEEAKKT